MGITTDRGLAYVSASLLDAVGATRAMLWVADADHVLRPVSAGPQQHDAPASAVFGDSTVIVRTPADETLPAVAVLAVDGGDRQHLQKQLDEAAPALEHSAAWADLKTKARLSDGVLEAIADQAAVLDADGVIVATNSAWTRTPVSHRRVMERSPLGTAYAEALRSQVSRPARIAADGIEAVLRAALPSFQSDYDADSEHGERSYSLQVDPLPHGGAVVRHVDISFRKHLQRQLAHRATHDPLTGLPNRMVMNERLGQALIRASRTRGGIAVLFCDVDSFKQINDSYGHAVGDKVLSAVANRLQQAVRQSDVVARFGGDEFVVLLEDIPDEASAHVLALRLQSAVTKPIMVEGRPMHFSVSIGLTVRHAEIDTTPSAVDAIMADADAAMYLAKEAGRGNIRSVDGACPVRSLPAGWDLSGISVLVQPIVNLDSGQTVCLEACARLDTPGGQSWSPADFLQRAEETGAIIDIGRQVLEHAVRFAAAQYGVHVSVNVSWAELVTAHYADDVLARLAAADVAPQRLELEVLIPAGGQVVALGTLRRLREAGVGIILDAFGRQPVELAALPELSATGLKVDRTLIAAAATGQRHARLVRGIVQMAHALGLSSTAEGIETPQQASMAQTLGFQRGQGFHFGTPAPLSGGQSGQ